ncbi:MAG: MAPEG family protein [Cyanobacteria bacterium P01_F01_bin.53]
MTIPVVSATVAAVMIILQQVLMVMVGLHRAKVGIGVGVGNDNQLERKVRRHGNLAENSALFIATLALAELLGASRIVVMGFGIAFVVARISHAIAFSSLAGSHVGAKGSKVFPTMRAIGAFGTLLSGVGLGLFLAFTVAAA